MFALLWSLWTRLHLVGMFRFVFDIKQPSLPTPVLVSVSVFMALSTVFHSINSLDNPPLSHSVLPVLSLCLIGPFNYILLYESLLQPFFCFLTFYFQFCSIHVQTKTIMIIMITKT